MLGSTTRPENRIIPVALSLMRKKKGRLALKVTILGFLKIPTAPVAAAASVPSSLTEKYFIMSSECKLLKQTFEQSTFDESLLFYDRDVDIGLANHITEICFIREHIRYTNFLHRLYYIQFRFKFKLWNVNTLQRFIMKSVKSI